MTTRDTLAHIRRTPWPEQHGEIHALTEEPSELVDLVLLALLDDGDAAVREAAMDVLCKRGPTYGRVAARALCGDTSALVRIEAADHLGQVGNRRDARRLRAILQDDDDWAVRSSAADSLGLVGGRAAHPALRRAMECDPHPIVRRDAAVALCYADDAAVAPWLEAALAVESEEQARLGMLESLYALGRRERLPERLALLRSGDDCVRHAATNTLRSVAAEEDAELAAQAIEHMLESEESPGLRRDAAEAVGELRGVPERREPEQADE